MAPHSSTLAWKIPWMEEPGRVQSMGSLRVGQTERLHFHFSLSCFGEGDGNPLQCSCLENPRDRGSLVGYRLWGRTESDTTEVTQQQQDGSKGFPSGSDGKESAYNAGDLGSITRLGRSPGGGSDNPLQCYCLENPHGQRSLGGYGPRGRKESDTIDRLSTTQHKGFPSGAVVKNLPAHA